MIKKYIFYFSLWTFFILFNSFSLGDFVLAKEAAGRVVTLTGEANIRNDSENKKIAPVKVGDTIYQGEMINTSSDASVKLLMTDKTILDIGPSSLFKVSEYKLKNVEDRQVELQMDYGKIRALVNQKVKDRGRIQMRTKAAVMGVRGTEFIVDAGAPNVSQQSTLNSNQAIEIPKTEIVVVSGVVEVATPQVSKADQNIGRSNASSASPSTSLTAGSKMTAVLSPQPEPAANGVGSASRTPTSQNESKVEKLSENEVSQIKSESSIVQPTLASIAVASASKSEDSKKTQGSNEGPANKAGLSDSILTSVGETVKNAPTYTPNSKELSFRGDFTDLTQLPKFADDKKTLKESANIGVIFSY